MLKLLANLKIFSRCTTLHSAGGNSVFLAKSYTKPSIDEILQRTKEVSEWIKTLNEAEKKKVRYIQNEIAVYSLEARSLQIERIRVFDLRAMLTMSNGQRKKYYNYLSSTISKQDHNTRKKTVGKEVRGSVPDQHKLITPQDPDRISYSLSGNTLIRRLNPQHLDAMKNRKVYLETKLNGPQLIFDCSFGNIMTYRESVETAEQLTACIGLNRDHRNPFSLQFSNLDRQSQLWWRISIQCPTISDMLWHFHTTDYRNQLPKDKIIILTPDSPNLLKEFKPNMHYVLEASVNRSKRGPIMMAKAKELGFQTAALPLKLYRTMQRTREFPLQNLTQVLLDVRLNGDWDRAFNHLPQRVFK